MSKLVARVKPAHFFAEHPVFPLEEFVASTPGRPAGTVKALLRYHTKRGNLVRLRRGLYIVADWFDPYAIASRCAPDAVLAYDGALALQRPWLDDPLQLPERVSFLTTTRNAGLDYDTLFNAVRPAAALGKRWDRDAVELERGGLTLRVTPPERTLVDLLDRLELGPPPFELWESFAYGNLDPEAMVAHALALKSRIVAARLGFFLEYRPGTPRKQLELLERRRPRSPAYFDRVHRTRKGCFFSRWNLVVPLRLTKGVERTSFRGRTAVLPRDSELPED